MKKRMLAVFLVVAMLFSTIPVTALAAEPVYGPIGENLITNGSFEQLDENGYPVGVGAGSDDVKVFGTYHTVVSGEGNVTDGNYAVRINEPNGKTARIRMVAPSVEPNTTYVFSFKVKGSAYQKMGANIEGYADGVDPNYGMNTSDASNVTPNPDDWTTLTYVFENTVYTSFAFNIWNGWAPLDVIIDEVSLYKYGEIETGPEYLSENLFLNGGFEQLGGEGRPLNTSTGGMGDQQVWGTNWGIETNEENVYEGNNSLMASTASWTMIYPKHSDLEAGATYEISYKIKGSFIADGADKAFGLNFLYNGGNTDVDCGGTPVIAKANEWTTYTAEFTVPKDIAAVYGIGLHLAWGNGTVYLDDFQCYKIAEPEVEEPEPDEPEEPTYGPIGDNLVVNGGFETVADGRATGFSILHTTADPWTNFDGWGDKGIIVTDDVASGNNALRIVDNEGRWTRLAFDVTGLKADTDYIISFKVKGTSTQGIGPMLNGGALAAEALTDTLPKADEWTTVSYLCKNGTDSTMSILINNGWENLDVLIDDITMHEYGEIVDEPDGPSVPDGYISYVTDSVDGKNWVRNNGGTFENGWDFGAWVGSKVITGEDAFEGNSYAEMTSDTATTSQLGVVAVTLPTPGTTVKLAVMVKGDAGKLIGHLQHYRNDNSHIGNDIFDIAEFEASEDWQQLVYDVTLPADVGGTTGGGTEIYLKYAGEGTLYVDDVQFFYPKAEEPEEPTYGNNVMNNGSFEQLANGKPVGVGTDYGSPTQNGWDTKHFLVTGADKTTDGDYAMRIVDNEAAWARLVMTAAVEPNRSYLLTMDVKGTASSKLGAIIYAHGPAGDNYDLGVSAECQVEPKADEWTTLEYVYENGGYTSLEFLISCVWNNCDIIIDNVQLREIGGTATEPDPEEPEDVIPEIPHENTNYVVNGSFEDLDDSGKPLGMGFNGWGESATLVTEEEYVTDGNNAIKLELAESGWTYANLRANVEPNTEYVLYMDGRGTSNLKIGADIEYWRNDSGDAATAHIQHTDTGAFTKPVNPDEWTTMYWTFTTPAECHMMEIAVSIPWSTGTLYVDNIRVYRVANNLADNGNFEIVEDGKAVGINTCDGWDGSKMSLATEPENVYEGSYALKMNSSDNGHTFAQIPGRYLIPGATYQVSFWAKGSIATANGKFGYDLEQYTDNFGHNQAEFWGGLGEGASFLLKEDEWTYCVAYFTLPDDIVAVNLTMGWIGGPGTVYLDDVRIQKYGDASVGKMYNEHVFYYPEDGTGFAEITFAEGYNVADNYTLNVALTDGSLVIAEETDVEIVNNYAKFDYSLAELTKKEHAYTVIATLVDENGEVFATVSEDIYIYDRPTVLNENGEYVEADGSIFNPVYAFWGPNDWSENADLVAAGVNTILWTIPGTEEEALKQLDDLHALGMKANVVMFWSMEPTGHPMNAERVIESMNWIKDHPAIYAWNVADEPYATANPPEGSTVRDLMIESYKVIRSVDKKYPVTYVEADYREYAHADDYADIIIIDPYPGTSSFASYVGDRAADITSKVDRPVGVLHQSFNFAGCKPVDYELHSMIYQAYLGGAEQMGHYGIGGAGELESDEELWPVVQGVYDSGEWEILFQQYSSNTNSTIDSLRDSDVWYDVFELDGVVYAAVQNRTYNGKTVTIALGDDITAVEAIKWADDVAVDATVADGVLTVNLTAAQAVLLELTVEAAEEETELDVVIEELPTDAGYYGEAAKEALEELFGAEDTIAAIKAAIEAACEEALAAMSGLDMDNAVVTVLEISLKFWNGQAWEKITEENLDLVPEGGMKVFIPFEAFGFEDIANRDDYKFIVKHMITLPTDGEYDIGDIEDLSNTVVVTEEGIEITVEHGFSPFAIGYAKKTHKFVPDDTNVVTPVKPHEPIKPVKPTTPGKDNVGTGGSSYKVLASLAGFAAVAAGALVVSDKKFSTK